MFFFPESWWSCEFCENWKQKKDGAARKPEGESWGCALKELERDGSVIHVLYHIRE